MIIIYLYEASYRTDDNIGTAIFTNPNHREPKSSIMLNHKNMNNILLTGVLSGLAFGANAAQSAQGKSDTAQKESQDTMTVLSPRVKREAGTKTTLTANDLLKEGGNTFGNIMRYQPLVSAPGVSAGATAGKSNYDRGGYSGYNIRRLENNRVSIDIDGVELPAGTRYFHAARSRSGRQHRHRPR